MRATRADLLFRALDTPERTADYCIAIDFSPGLAKDILSARHANVLSAGFDPEDLLARLERGAQGARIAFPKSEMILHGKRWVPGNGFDPIAFSRGPADQALAILEAFVNVPLAVKKTYVRQLLYLSEDTGRLSLYSRLHHSLGDGASAFMFLETQMAVAFERTAAPTQAAPLARIRHHDAPVWRSPYAFDRPATRLCPPEEVGGRKLFRLRSIPAGPLRAFIERHQRRFKYNDLLLALLVEALRRWPDRPEGDLYPQVLLPMNTRESAFEGFGNNAAMVSLYPSGTAEKSYADRALEIRAQVDWAKDNGAWYRPPEGPLFRATPFFVIRPIIRAFARRGRATLVFSHLERQSDRGWEQDFPEIARTFIISPIAASTALMFAVVTQHDTTYLCATFRERPLQSEVIDRLLDVCEDVANDIARQAVEPRQEELEQR